MARKGIENLKPQSSRTKDEQRKIASAGGKASGEARRKQKTMREQFELLLSMDSENKFNGSNQQEMCVAMLREAKKGNVKAFEAIRDTIGQKPTDKTAAQVNGEMVVKWLD